MKFLKELVPYLVIALVVIMIRLFIIEPVRVDGPSMYPTLKNNDFLLLEKVDRNYKRFDIVVINYNGEQIIKRIIGLPGEYVQYLDGKLYINDELVDEPFKTGSKTSDFNLTLMGYDKVPDNSYFVVGDNRSISKDSRIIGFIPKSDIQGKAIWNLLKFKKVK